MIKGTGSETSSQKGKGKGEPSSDRSANYNNAGDDGDDKGQGNNKGKGKAMPYNPDLDHLDPRKMELRDLKAENSRLEQSCTYDRFFARNIYEAHNDAVRSIRLKATQDMRDNPDKMGEIYEEARTLINSITVEGESMCNSEWHKL